MAKISGGEKLQAALNDIAKNLTKAATLQVGFFEGHKEPNGESSALVAMVQEFGSPAKGIPPRPFFRPMVAEKSPEWPDMIVALLKDNGFDAKKTLNAMGEVIAGELKVSITNVQAPPLSPVTVMLRGMRSQARYRDLPFWEAFAEAKDRVAAGKTNYGASTKPLIDSGSMIQAIGYEVKE